MNFQNTLYTLAIAWAVSAPVSWRGYGADYITNFGSIPPPSSVHDSSFTPVSTSNTSYFGILFSSSQQFQLTEISIALASTSAFPASGYSIGLYNANSGIPTTEVTTVPNLVVVPGTLGARAGTVNTFTAADINAITSLLLPAGDYAIVLGGTASLVKTYANPDPIITAPSAGTFLSYIGTATKSSGTWASFPGNSFIAIGAISSASPVPEASGSVAGLGLAVAGLYQLRRRRHLKKWAENGCV